MKFFNKDRSDEGSLGVGVTDFINNPTQAQPSSRTQRESHAATRKNHATQSSIAYGIQDVVELMQTLPDADPELMMPIVIRTLESANINVSKIISDAAQREETMEAKSVDLISQIEELEEKISAMNDQIMSINDSLEEISNVKNLLLSSFLDENVEAEQHHEEDESDESLMSKLNLTDENIEEVAQQLMEEDANFDDIDIDDVISQVDKINIAQKA
jgi:DNA repair exonuclease SbcCD ATPase subunit